MNYCPRVKTIISSWDFKPGFLSIARMRCRQWDCSYCATKNGDMWRAHLLHQLCEVLTEKKWLFITLTVPPYAHAMHAWKSLALLKKAWNGIYDKLRWLNRGKFSYVLVYETHASGIFHVHCLCSLGAHYDKYTVWDFERVHGDERIACEKMHPVCLWLRKKAILEHLGWVVHVTRVGVHENALDGARKALGYLSKYLSKGAGEVIMPPRWRRIGTSQDIGSPRTKNTSKYTWSLKGAINHVHARHEKIWLVSEKRTLAASDFGDDGYYPPLDPITK